MIFLWIILSIAGIVTAIWYIDSKIFVFYRNGASSTKGRKKEHTPAIIIMSVGLFSILKLFRILGVHDFLSSLINVHGFLLNVIITLVLIVITIIFTFFVYTLFIKSFIILLNQRKLAKRFVDENYNRIKKINNFRVLSKSQIKGDFSNIIVMAVNTYRNLHGNSLKKESIEKYLPEISRSIIRLSTQDPQEIEIMQDFIKFYAAKISKNIQKYI